MTQDEQNLDVLGIFHYVVGAVTALFACFSVIHLVIGIAMISGKLGGNNPPPAAIGWLFVILTGVFISLGWILSAVMILTGRYLRQRRRRMFCFIVACVECMMMPFGTVLGIFTIIHLNKEPVRELFPQ
jgi:uncharacterized membrane protein